MNYNTGQIENIHLNVYDFYFYANTEVVYYKSCAITNCIVNKMLVILIINIKWKSWNNPCYMITRVLSLTFKTLPSGIYKTICHSIHLGDLVGFVLKSDVCTRLCASPSIQLFRSVLMSLHGGNGSQYCSTTDEVDVTPCVDMLSMSCLATKCDLFFFQLCMRAKMLCNIFCEFKSA